MSIVDVMRNCRQLAEVLSYEFLLDFILNFV
jgi:hypothetical protein